MRRALALAGAVLCLALAAGALLLAADVARVETRFAADDARFAARPVGSGYWSGEELLPLGLARRALGVADDLEHRRAVEAFWLSGPRLPNAERARLVAERARAQQLLTAAEPRADTPRRRAQLAVLRGVLSLVATNDEGNRRSLAQAAADNFSRAVQRDPSYEDAKFNLEVMLKNADITTGGGAGGSGSAGRRKGSQVGGAASSSAGSGY